MPPQLQRTPTADPPCIGLIARPLGEARDLLGELLNSEVGTLLKMLGWIEAALESSLEPGQRETVREHCRRALEVVAAIEQRHRDRPLPYDVVACSIRVCDQVNQAIKTLDQEQLGPGSRIAVRSSP
jgi:hypothetical protein